MAENEWSCMAENAWLCLLKTCGYITLKNDTSFRLARYHAAAQFGRASRGEGVISTTAVVFVAIRAPLFYDDCIPACYGD
jgi:hypothetical protein